MLWLILLGATCAVGQRTREPNIWGIPILPLFRRIPESNLLPSYQGRQPRDNPLKHTLVEPSELATMDGGPTSKYYHNDSLTHCAIVVDFWAIPAVTKWWLVYMFTLVKQHGCNCC